MSPRRFLLPTLLFLVACEPEGTRSETSALVECRGLTHGNLLWRTARSPLFSIDPATGEAGPSRCTFNLSQTLTGADVDLSPGYFFDLDTVEDLAMGWFYADGTWWQIDGGTLSFDTFDDTLAIGSYALDATSVDVANNPTGRAASFEGPFSWCEGTREDCPFRYENTLQKSAVIDTPVMLPTEAGLTACRMLVDPATGALDVELQIGTWRGTNVAQIWVNECGGFGTQPPQGNLLHFQAGATTGPGSYGPHPSRVMQGGVRLPMLDFAHPATFYGTIDQTEACMLFYPLQARVSATDDTICSWTVEENPGKFTLTCDNAFHHEGGGAWPQTTGEFSLEADCDYIER